MQILIRDVIVSITIMLVVLVILRRKNKLNLECYWGLLLFSIINVCVFSLTGISPISGFHLDYLFQGMDIIPFLDLFKMLKNGEIHSVIWNAGGNILLFSPIGFMLPLLWRSKYHSLFKTAVTGFGLSLLIECSQLFLLRATDVNDLIMNTIGAILGYLIYLLAEKCFVKYLNYFQIHENIPYKSKMVYLLSAIIIPYITIVMLGFYDRFIYFEGYL